MKFSKLKHFAFLLLMAAFFCKLPVNAEGMLTVTTECTEANCTTIKIDVADSAVFDGIEIYRADAKNGPYQIVDEIDLTNESEDDYSFEDDYEGSDYSFYDREGLIAYQTYYYQIKAYQNVNGLKTYIESVDTEVLVLGAAPIITYNKRNSKLNAKLKWKKAEGADGYLIYCMKDYDSKNNYKYIDPFNYSKYSLVKTIKNPNTTSATFKKLKNGLTYTYVIYAYKNINGARVKSVPSTIKSITMDYYGYEWESYNKKMKRVFGSEKKKRKNFSTASKARKQMKTIKIKVWDYKKGKKGKKITKTKTLVVNKKLAPTIQEMFKEIYKSKEKQVIKDIGCYSYRTGEHIYGTAIDVNWNENYMIDGKKKLAGSYWKPKKDPYSIPQNSQFVKIMRRYGFYRGEWGKRKDYMHFSFFGT